MFSVNVFILNMYYLRYYISRFHSEKTYEVMNMYKPFGRILYGGDYNPNQWPKEVWEQDMAYFKDARINSATINVFSWAKIQPSEEEYCFDELDEIVEMLSKENYDLVMATSTGAMPA